MSDQLMSNADFQALVPRLVDALQEQGAGEWALVEPGEPGDRRVAHLDGPDELRLRVSLTGNYLAQKLYIRCDRRDGAYLGPDHFDVKYHDAKQYDTMVTALVWKPERVAKRIVEEMLPGCRRRARQLLQNAEQQTRHALNKEATKAGIVALLEARLFVREPAYLYDDTPHPRSQPGDYELSGEHISFQYGPDTLHDVEIGYDASGITGLTFTYAPQDLYMLLLEAVRDYSRRYRAAAEGEGAR